MATLDDILDNGTKPATPIVQAPPVQPVTGTPVVGQNQTGDGGSTFSERQVKQWDNEYNNRADSPVGGGVPANVAAGRAARNGIETSSDNITAPTAPQQPVEPQLTDEQRVQLGREARGLTQPTGANAEEPAQQSAEEEEHVFSNVDGTPMLDRNGNPITYKGQLTTEKMIDILYGYKQKTKEELEAERKREKRQKIIAAVGDGLSALANLYFTTKGAPNAFDGTNTMSAKAKERWDKIKAQRTENWDNYMKLKMAARQTDLENAQKKDAYQLQVQKEANDQAYIEFKMGLQRAEAERDAEIDAVNLEVLHGKKKQQDALAEIAEIKAKYQKEREELNNALLKARAGAANRSNTGSRSSGGSSARPAEFSAWDENGVEHKFHTRAAADAFAEQHGTASTSNKTTQTVRKNARGKTKGTSTSTRQGTSHAAIPANAKKPNSGKKNKKIKLI